MSTYKLHITKSDGTTEEFDPSVTVATGDSNGQIKINGTNVSVKGLGSAAYTASTAYATASHTHSYEPTSTAVRHTDSTAVGSATQPSYVASNGTATACTYSLNKTVPSDAVFTDTVTTASTTGSGNAVTAISASNGALTVTKGSTFLTSHQDISGKQDKTTAVTHTASTAVGSATNPVYVNSSGVATACTYSLNKTVPSDAVFTDTTYSVATTTANGLMSSSDFSKLAGIQEGAQVNAVTSVNGMTGAVTVSGGATPASISAGTAGSTSNQSKSVDIRYANVGKSCSFTVPYVTVNSEGIVTGYGNRSVTLTSNCNDSNCTD